MRTLRLCLTLHIDKAALAENDVATLTKSACDEQVWPQIQQLLDTKPCRASCFVATGYVAGDLKTNFIVETDRPRNIPLDENSLPEFKDQLIDSIEDCLSDWEIVISNPARDEYVAEAGFDEDDYDVANIFGNDYDRLGDIIEQYVSGLNMFQEQISAMQMEEIVGSVICELKDILNERGSRVLTEDEEHEILVDLANTFDNWRLLSREEKGGWEN